MWKRVKLVSYDGECFEVEQSIAMQSQTIKNFLTEDDDNANEKMIPLPNVMGKILSKVLEYCKKHEEVTEASEQPKISDDEEMKKWDAEFVDVDTNELYHLLMAAHYLEIKGLFNLGCQKVADLIKGKMPEEIRQIFNIKNDFTPEQEKEIRSKHSWAYQ